MSQTALVEFDADGVFQILDPAVAQLGMVGGGELFDINGVCGTNVYCATGGPPANVVCHGPDLTVQATGVGRLDSVCGGANLYCGT